MTLFKQIIILLTVFLLILLLTVMGLNFKTATRYAQEQLYTDAQDTAASLSLSLGTARGDLSTMSTMVNAVFDSGYYREIALHDTQGKTLYKRHSETPFVDVPLWFTDFVSLNVPTASAQVSSGWNPIGILEVTSLENNTYIQLYKTFTHLLVSFATISLIAFILLNILLHIVLKSLKKVQQQAEAITDNEFFTNEEIPFTTEFKDATIAMNTMVKKAKEIFVKEAKTLKMYHGLLYKDAVTDLANRRLFALRLSEYIASDSKKSEGTLFFMALEGLLELNNTLGHQNVDAMLKEFGTIISTVTPRRHSSLAVRLNGTEFSLLIPTLHKDESIPIATIITEKTKELFRKYHSDSLSFFISIVEYHAGDSLKSIFSKADYGLSTCRRKEPFCIYCETGENTLDKMGKHEWSDMIAGALENDRLTLALQPVSCGTGIYHEEAFLRLIDAEGEIHTAGRFMPIAHMMKMEPQIDKHIIEKVLTLDHTLQHNTAINLSADFISSAASLQWITKTLQDNRPLKPLSFEISDQELVGSLEACTVFARTIRRLGHRFGIDKFTVHYGDLHYLQQVKPSYVKVDRTYLNDIIFGDQSGFQSNALFNILDSLDITLIATAIEDEESMKRLKKAGINCFQGSYIAEASLMQ